MLQQSYIRLWSLLESIANSMEAWNSELQVGVIEPTYDFWHSKLSYLLGMLLLIIFWVTSFVDFLEKGLSVGNIFTFCFSGLLSERSPWPLLSLWFLGEDTYPFWANLVEKFRIVSLKFRIVLFFCFRPEYSLWANLVQKINIVSLSWNFVPTILVILFWNFTIF